MASTNPTPLKKWYASDDVKRRLGAICQSVNETGRTVYILGSSQKPLLTLIDSDDIDADPSEVQISVDDARANWTAVTAAALFFGTTFRILGRKQPRAVLRAHSANRHDAFKYQKSQNKDLSKLIDRLNEIVEEMSSLFDGLAQSADVIDRRFKEVWRTSQGLGPLQALTQH